MRSAANPPHAAAAVARCLPVRLSVCLRLKFKVRKHISQDVLCYGLEVKGQRYTMPQKICHQLHQVCSYITVHVLNFTSVAAVHIMFLCRFYWARALNTCIPRELFTLEFFSSGWGWLGCRVVSVLDSGAEGPGYKSQPRRCRVTVLGKLFTPVVSLFTKQQNW